MRSLKSLLVTLLLCVTGFGGWLLISHPETPLPRQWHPTKRLYVSDPVTPLTRFKLDAATGNPALCKEVLAEAQAGFQGLPDLTASPQCGIEGRVSLRSVGQARLAPVETSCAIALRMAMWERHGLQPAAQAHFGAGIAGIGHFSSYNCRAIRTSSGEGSKMSTHATAEAIDIFGFTLTDGRQLIMKRDWQRENEFFKAAQDSACDWFPTTLGPEYNKLHADHFHLQSTGWGTCW